ncbi:MAG: AraC family transcriptional regulator [Acutalibacteraceae bacterium]|nr:AraC family transcriptional regulator [Acutalibacteraceae bacterium]
MYSLKAIDNYIYNKEGDVVLRLTNNTIFAGMHTRFTNQYAYFEIWYLQSQRCNLEISSRIFNLHQGDILVFSQNDDKEVINSDSNALFSVLQIDADTFNAFMPYSSLLDAYSFFTSHSEQFNNRIPASSPVAQTVRNQLSNIIEAFATKKQGYEISVLKACLDIILIIAGNTNYCDIKVEKKNSDSAIKVHKSLKKAFDYIDSHLTDELTLEKISTIAELSPNYLSNIFREQTGTRLWDYIVEKRIRLATQLLIDNPEDSVISVALKCGFNNCPNFNRAFKKYTGQTPKKYKTSILRQENQL